MNFGTFTLSLGVSDLHRQGACHGYVNANQA